MISFKLVGLYTILLSGSVLAAPTSPNQLLSERSSSSNVEGYCQAPLLDPSSYVPVKDNILVFVQALFRHGARVPTSTISLAQVEWFDCNSPLNVVTYTDFAPNEVSRGVPMKQTILSSSGKKGFGFTYWKGNCVAGQLTDQGKVQAKATGANLRKIYVDKQQYLSDTLQVDADITTRTTNVWRTRDTVAALLSGLYPEQKRAEKAYVTMGYLPDSVENMYDNAPSCPQISVYQGLIAKSKSIQDMIVESQGDMFRIATTLGINTAAAGWNSTWATIFDSLASRKCSSKLYPCNAQGQCLSDTDTAMAAERYHFEQQYLRRDSKYAKQYLQYAQGSFFNDLLTDIAKAVDADKLNPAAAAQGTRRLSLFSAHDTTVSSILGALNATNNSMVLPPYMSMIIFEVWRDNKDGEYSIRAILNNQVLTVNSLNGSGKPWCDFNKCKLQDYTSHLSQFILDDYQQQCKVSK